MMFTTTGTAQASTATTSVASTVVADTTALVSEFNALSDGQAMTIAASNTSAGFTVVKQGGQAVVTATGVAKIVRPGQMRTAGFCHWAALAAVYAIGSAGLAFLAASGGAVVAGVFLSARILGQMAAALAGGSGFNALVAAYLC